MSASLGSRNLLLVSLTRFYSQGDHLRRVLPLILGESSVSLRLIDWFVTNYSRKHSVVLTQMMGNNVVHFNVHLSYRSQLKAYSKQQFDPFRRRDRIMFYDDTGKFVETTVGQLNFFRWMLQNGVLTYVQEHAEEVEREMLAAAATTAAAAAATAAASAAAAPDAAPALAPAAGCEDVVMEDAAGCCSPDGGSEVGLECANAGAGSPRTQRLDPGKHAVRRRRTRAAGGADSLHGPLPDATPVIVRLQGSRVVDFD